MNDLFFKIPENILIRSLLTVKQLNTAMKMKKAKNPVRRKMSFSPLLKLEVKKLFFKKKIERVIIDRLKIAI